MKHRQNPDPEKVSFPLGRRGNVVHAAQANQEG